jgi:SAM-dependent methyltransferase
MTNYAGRYAELYDLFYADKPYADEAAFVHECIREFGSRPTRDVLELACGTGRHALELERLGYNVTATDRSPDMLEIARRSARGRNVDLVLAEMRQLDLPRKNFDAAVCLFDSIGYLKTSDAIASALTRTRDHLRQGAVFIFEFWHAPAMLNGYSPVRERRWKIDNGEITRTSETALDRKNHLAKVVYTIEERKHDGSCRIFRESHVNRFFSVNEMETLLSRSKFSAMKFFAGFSRTEPITDGTWHIVAVAQKS